MPDATTSKYDGILYQECTEFCGCCGDCLRCYGDGVNCWWCTDYPDDPPGCQRCAVKVGEDRQRPTARGAGENGGGGS